MSTSKNLVTEKEEILLAQWQTCVEMANATSQRRDTMNNIFMSLNIAIIAAVAFVWDLKSLLIMFAGIIVCILWIYLIRNYKLLNTAKFEIINSIEEKLPSAPFQSEWDILKKNEKYYDSTKLEKILPYTFMGLYTVATIVMIIMKFTI